MLRTGELGRLDSQTWQRTDDCEVDVHDRVNGQHWNRGVKLQANDASIVVFSDFGDPTDLLQVEVLVPSTRWI